MNKCLIAGLPDAGKSTYIAALAYILEHPSDEQALRINVRSSDRGYINKLSEAWLSQETLERTVQGGLNRINFSILDKDSSNFILSIPDIAGEEFKSLIQKRDSVLDDWDSDCNCLLLFINNLPNVHILQEQIGEISPSSDNTFPEFSVDLISVDIQIVLMVKALLGKFNINKLTVCISAWDELSEDFATPADCLIQRSPILYNFVKYYFPKAQIFGVSAQGGKYDDNIVDELYECTTKNQRAYVVTPEGETKYDITLPLKSFF